MVKDIQFVTDAEGRETAAVVPISLYEAFQDYMEDRGLALAAREALEDEERIPWEQIKAESVAQGRLNA